MKTFVTLTFSALVLAPAAALAAPEGQYGQMGKTGRELSEQEQTALEQTERARQEAAERTRAGGTQAMDESEEYFYEESPTGEQQRLSDEGISEEYDVEAVPQEDSMGAMQRGGME